MARIRTTKPDFWADDRIGTLSRDARLLFIATWNLADDEGLLRWTPAYLKAEVFRYDWEITEAAVSDLMAELANAELICPYTSGRTREPLAWVVNFRRHQKINRPQPGRMTPPSLQAADVLNAYLRRDKYMCHLCRGPIPQEYIDKTNADACLNASLDHVRPRCHGGDDYPSNIRVSHVGCNKARRDRPVDAFRQPDSVRHALGGLGVSAALPHSSPAAPPPWSFEDGDSRPDSLPDSRPDSRARSLNELPSLGNPEVSDSLPDSLVHSLPEGKRKGKGREEKQPPAVAVRDAEAAPLQTITAQTVTAAWVDRVRHNGVEPTRTLVGQAARTVKQLLDGGNDPERVLDAACRAAAKGYATIDRELMRSTADPDADRRDPRTGRIVDWA